MVRALYLRLYDRVFAHPTLLVLLVGTVSGGSAWLVPGIDLDMSFRPLFGQDEGELEATRLFEERFGQRSGAYIGTIVTPDRWTPDFVAALASASEEVSTLEYVSEVVSLSRAVTADWSADSIRAEWIIDPESLESISESEFYATLVVRDELAREGTLVSADGARTLILARLSLSLEDLERRARVIDAFQAAVDGHLSRLAHRRWVGISVVEEAYSRLVLEGLAWSLGLTTLVLLMVLGWVFRRPAAVGVVMAGVTLALPLSLAVMVARGQAITIVNSMVPTMIMVIGVADAIHMFECFADHHRRGLAKGSAVRAMFGDMALPCLLTALTTIVGLLALETARISALRDFGLNVAVGIAAVYVLNLLALPALLRLLPTTWLLAERPSSSALVRWRTHTADLLIRAPKSVAAVSAVAILVCAAGASQINVDQRFNEDVAADHPVRVSQDIYESEFNGFLGPDVRVGRADGGSVLGGVDRERIARFEESLRGLAGVIHVESVLEHVPDSVSDERALAGVRTLRSDAFMGARIRDLIDEEARTGAVVVRTADIGSKKALELVGEIERLAARDMGAAYEVQVVGQWWLAQLGLSNILRDMLVTFATSFLFVLPLLAFALGNVRLFLAGVIPNLLPMLFALGFMGWTGISVRVGTAMVLAIALAIAVDDTIHVLVRLKEAQLGSSDPEDHVRSAIQHSAGPVLVTTVVLVAGFLSMRINGLVAIQDMGLVAAATLAVAGLADVYFLPAAYLILGRLGTPAERPAIRSGTARGLSRFGAPTTSPDV